LCGSCRTELPPDSRFCNKCGTPVAHATQSAEYKQVTVLFADVVHSMDIAATVGAERLREIMTELVERAAAVVHRYGGTVDKFTGDGIMAVFGAPAALEDHAIRACLAALGIQEQAKRLAVDVQDRDGVELQLRVGLNSGQVITGEIGSGAFGYTAVGEQVGMAQRMESIAAPGAVMLSESTARLVEHAAVLEDTELVRIKGFDAPVIAHRLLDVASEREPKRPAQPTLVGRELEVHTVSGILDRSISGRGSVVGVVGPSGIGKSRLVREAMDLAKNRGVEVFSTYCESHATQIPFHAVARMLRTVFGIGDIAPDAARAGLRSRIPDGNPEDLLLLDDLLGIGDPGVALPAITADARRRRLAALLNTAALARTTPAVYVIEDAHWIDEASESMLAEFVTIVPQTPSLVLITYRPEYRGALSRAPGAQTIGLAPLNVAQTVTLIAELLGSHPSVSGLTAQVAERAAGNPFFADEMVRDLAERGVLTGGRGEYLCREKDADIGVPDTLQATIAARIDRLRPPAKHVLNAAAVIGARFRPDLLTVVLGDTGESGAALAELLQVELVDQVMFTPRAEFAFRHPLIRTVAYESQLRAGRAELHRRVAAAIEERDASSADQNAALIAEHLEAAGDLRAAFDWHMRAGTWSAHRDRAAARISWQRARHVADRLPADHKERVALQIAPLTLLCGTAWHAGGSVADAGFEELRELCIASGDKESLAIGMAGLVMALAVHKRVREASQLASELTGLVESIGDLALMVGLLYNAGYAKWIACEVTQALRLAQRVIDLAEGDPTKGNLLFGSPLSVAIAFRGVVRMCMGIHGWHSDVDAAIAMAAPLDPSSHVMAIMYKYVLAIQIGALPADAAALQETADALRIAEQVGDDYALSLARLTRGLVMVHHGGPLREEGFALLTQVRDAALRERFFMLALVIVDPEIAREKARNGDLDGAIELARATIDDMLDTGAMLWHGVVTTALVESLLERGADGDLAEAEAAIDQLENLLVDFPWVARDIAVLRLRAVLSQARRDEAAYQQFVQRYRAMATSLGFEGHMAWAEAMP
jgi:class 3 adenylate cyclase